MVRLAAFPLSRFPSPRGTDACRRFVAHIGYGRTRAPDLHSGIELVRGAVRNIGKGIHGWGVRNQSFIELLIDCPWWVSVIVSAAIYIGLAVVLPSIEFKSVPFQAMAKGVAPIATFVALIFLVPAPISAFNSWRKRQLVDRQTGIQSIRALSCKQFEELVAEAYRRKGYTVIENPGEGQMVGWTSGSRRMDSFT